ncbi:MAG: sulfite exporter TauE/SafE family protein [Defluviimonas sp.]|uniref:TSUP family transporter n=1 Tax=Albidovulum sp. TaxID=1872424 RepID=UPI001DC2FD32|nr:sulfite exporter TauE/SafE family protein [Paracoccaceae bacterium]MCC0062883.1 sulfite exporter TauE/SafE family protein [Defluviimonas sp.]
MDALLAHVSATPGLALAVLTIAFAASVVQFGLGMGFGLMAAPLLAVIDPMLVPAPALFIGLVTSAWGAWAERAAIRWNEVGTALVGRLAGVGVAMVGLSLLPSRDAFSLIFGLFIAAALLLSLSGRRLGFTPANLIAMATLSGLMATFTSVGAPPLAIIYQDRPARDARPTLAAFFAIGCAISLAGLHLTGWAGPRDAALALLMLPGVFVGRVVAGRIGGRFDRRYRPLLLVIAAMAATVLILRGAL